MSTQSNSGEQPISAQPPLDIVEQGKQKLESFQSELEQARQQRLMAEKMATYWKSSSENLRQVSIKRNKSYNDLKKSNEELVKANQDLKKAFEDMRKERDNVKMERNLIQKEKEDLEKRLHDLFAGF
ncbi:hypothetical protein FOQG_18616 [Fusarium oxysporum f. sp. raphani 54005]|uniref:Uncharacterized protein n=5 Tax=Fusarium oxysporum TaxID=5507 RepID=X0C1I5_FUSOX|nr:hypothetical protein FOXB_14164 [Fusarium oxysporum f. sp. conglutinans Fo5176]EXK76647.1 hypothetical protein FOQG_18616 [Fusarium oxysporum f. sp. raphani 54005]EXL74909.1 hypothetical protein FOPG_10022 [Fusarium oxysporum f. sp. conglutinans race 2 54008]KAF6518676.1 hypothetical protein HZS61_017050 [Fusarium oxysporum f. sp. conglutinans]KAG7432479.1 hypothetical protein Forpi1262_v006908 [Fusarium oxysporum f. sp. raphani]KAI8404782.1 hypothetical protein FOFC_14254 [Fusarium oxyspor